MKLSSALVCALVVSSTLAGLIMIPERVSADSEWFCLDSGQGYSSTMQMFPEPSPETEYAQSSAILSYRDATSWRADTDPGFYYLQATDPYETGTYGISSLLVDCKSLHSLPQLDDYDYFELRVHTAVCFADGYPTLSEGTLSWLNHSASAVKFGYRTGGHTDLVPGGWNDFAKVWNTSGTSWYWHANFIDTAGWGDLYTDEKLTTYGEWETNTFSGMPFTRDEIESMVLYVYVKWAVDFWTGITYYGQPPVLAYVTQLFAEVKGVAYDPIVYPDGFILWPDGVIYNAGWKDESASTIENHLIDSINETVRFSDRDESFIYTDGEETGYGQNFIELTFTDPPYWADEDFYNCTLFISLKAEDYGFDTTALVYFTMTVGNVFYPTGTYWGDTLWDDYVNTTWGIPWSDDPREAYPERWPLSMLTYIHVGIQSFLSPNMLGVIPAFNVSQIGILCAPSGGLPESWFEDQDGVSVDFSGWLQTDGFATMFGVLGFLGMLAVPPFFVLKAREGDTDFRDVITMIMLMALFFGLFITSITVMGSTEEIADVLCLAWHGFPS